MEAPLRKYKLRAVIIKNKGKRILLKSSFPERSSQEALSIEEGLGTKIE